MPENENLQEQPQNPFDTSAEESELNALQAELEQAQASIESDFAKQMADNTTPEMEELFFEDKEAFYKQILEAQNAYLAENITPKIERRDALSSDISQKKQFGSIDAALNAFKEKYPDADADALMAFFQNEIPPQVQQELQALPPERFFEEVYALYQAVKNGGGGNVEGENAEQLPRQINGVPNSSNEVRQGSADLPFTRI